VFVGIFNSELVPNFGQISAISILADGEVNLELGVFIVDLLDEQINCACQVK